MNAGRSIDRYAQYQSLTVRLPWSDPRSHGFARARLDHDRTAQFGLNHEAQTAQFITAFSTIGVPGMPPFQGVHAEVQMDGLHLMGYPFNGRAVYRILG